MLCRLVLFAALLLPAFLRIGWWYARSPRIHRSIPYGEKKLRQNLDVYVPRRNTIKKNFDKDTLDKDTLEKDTLEKEDEDELLPVLFFTGGGAWVVGHKAFCALLGRIFMTMGVLVISPDYRQFPQVEVSDMLHDIDSAIQWTFDHCKEYGGDPKRVFIAGQSAGAHLTSTLVLEHASSELKMRRLVSQGSGSGSGSGSGRGRGRGRGRGGEETLLRRDGRSPLPGLISIREEDEIDGDDGDNGASAEMEKKEEEEKKKKEKITGGSRDLKLEPWKCSQIAGYVGISGPYQLVHLREHLFHRGIEQLRYHFFSSFFVFERPIYRVVHTCIRGSVHCQGP